MNNPDLGEQLARVLASLEKATPQMLEIATRCMRFEAVANGAVYLVLFASSVCAALFLLRQLKRKAIREEVSVALTIALIVCLAATGLIMICLIPDQISKFANARYWAVADLLARVKP